MFESGDPKLAFVYQTGVPVPDIDKLPTVLLSEAINDCATADGAPGINGAESMVTLGIVEEHKLRSLTV